ncbi:MAG: type II toxin-antitoxin system prevent-host-death family antitoxin [Acidobacteria bacterium]|nr:MAG: type II toxin-antitoxin system prevent-host-death family antitoxin [Acidobacteriota bacterium]
MCYMAGVSTVGIRELRQNLSKYLRRVESGEAFRVTDRGRQVALLGPLPEESEFTDRLVASGRAIPARLDIVSLGQPPDRPVVMPISEALREQREED